MADDAPLVLMIQPTLGVETTRQTFQPLADYLGKTTGARFTVVTQPNFLAHWETVRRNSGYDLVLDDAHFTDYRVQKFGFHVLAKIPGTTSYSLIVPRHKPVRDPLELAGKTVASFGPPSIGATRLNACSPIRRGGRRSLKSAARAKVSICCYGKKSAPPWYRRRASTSAIPVCS